MIDPRFSTENGNFVDGRVAAVPQPETTGRQIVVFAEEEDDGVDWGRAGISSVADTRDFASGGMPPEAMQDSQATVFANLGIAVVAADPAQVSMLQTAESSGRRVLSVSPELVHHVLQDVLEYTRAYRDGVDDLAERVLHAADHDGMAAMAAAGAPLLFEDTTQFTWGIQAVEANSSPLSGRGIGVAVLDTGFDLAHPDFAGRTRDGAVVRTGRAGPGRARPRHALHRHLVRPALARRPGRATASRTRRTSSSARCSATPAAAPTAGSSPASTGRWPTAVR